MHGPIEMRFSHRGRPFFTADPVETDGYWMSRWMGYGSYVELIAHEFPHPPPLRAADYVMDFAVAGNWFRWDAPDSPIVPAPP